MSLRLTIRGGVPLRGSVSVSPSQYITDKFSILALLGNSETTLLGAPVHTTPVPLFDLAEFLGAHIEYDRSTVHITPRPFITPSIPEKSMIRPELLYILFFVVLSRSGRAALSINEYPLIAQKVRTFFSAHPQLPFSIEEQQNFLVVSQTQKADVRVAVGELDTLDDILALVILGVLSGTTFRIGLSSSIERISRELQFLTQMGANMQISEQEILITNSSDLEGIECVIPEDVEEIIFLVIAGVLTEGDIELKVNDQSLYTPIMNKLGQVGFSYKFNDNRLYVWTDSETEWKPITIKFTAQGTISERLRSIFAVAMSQFPGESKIIDLASPTGLDFTSTLKAVGIECVPHLESEFNAVGSKALRELSIIGPTKLSSGFFDLLNSNTTLAPIMVGLLADGETEIRGAEFLFYKYPYLISQLQSLGAKIKVVNE